MRRWSPCRVTEKFQQLCAFIRGQSVFVIFNRTLPNLFSVEVAKICGCRVKCWFECENFSIWVIAHKIFWIPFRIPHFDDVDCFLSILAWYNEFCCNNVPSIHPYCYEKQRNIVQCCLVCCIDHEFPYFVSISLCHWLWWTHRRVSSRHSFFVSASGVIDFCDCKKGRKWNIESGSLFSHSSVFSFRLCWVKFW